MWMPEVCYWVYWVCWTNSLNFLGGFFDTELKKLLRNSEIFLLVHCRVEAIFFLPSCNIALHNGDAADWFVVELKEVLLRKKSQNKNFVFI